MLFLLFDTLDRWPGHLSLQNGRVDAALRLHEAVDVDVQAVLGPHLVGHVALLEILVPQLDLQVLLMILRISLIKILSALGIDFVVLFLIIASWILLPKSLTHLGEIPQGQANST